MGLIDKHFLRHYKFQKLFNCNNVKLSCGCMPNMKSIIHKYNSKIMMDPKPTNNKTYTYRQKSDCFLNQSCLSEYLVVNTSML